MLDGSVFVCRMFLSHSERDEVNCQRLRRRDSVAVKVTGESIRGNGGINW